MINNKMELYSEDRLYNMLNSVKRSSSIEETVHQVKRSTEQFAQGAEQADDITMLMLRCFKIDGHKTNIFEK